MKIVYLANIRLPTEKAHGLQVMKMGEAFSQNGAQVELVLPGRKNPGLETVDPFDYYGLGRRFKLTVLKAYDPAWLLKFPGGSYIKVQSFFFCLKLWRYFLKNRHDRPDVFYTRDEYLLPWLFLFAKNIVWEGHDLPARKKFYLKYWQRCAKIVVISGGLKNELTALGIAPKRILVAADGVDPAEFEKFSQDRTALREKLGLPQNRRLLVYTGHLYDWKGADLLAEAAAGFSDDETFVFVGGTNREVADFKTKFGAGKNIMITGHKDHKLIPGYLKAADVLVLPNSAKKSISKYYTSPLKLFEYLAAGKPIVASDLPSLREILDESSAVFFTPDNRDSLALALKNILTDGPKAEAIAHAALAKSKNYSWSSRAKMIINYLSDNN